MSTVAGLVMPIAAFLSAVFPHVPQLVPGVLPGGSGVVVLAGMPKRGKTLLALDLFARLLDGAAWLGRPVIPRPALYVFLEGQADTIQERLLRLVSAPGPGHHVVIRPKDFRLDTPAGRAVLTDLVRSTGAKVVIIDPLAFAHELDENDNSKVAPMMRAVNEIAHELGILVILIHHQSKGGRDGDIRSIRGAGALTAATEANLLLSTYGHSHRLNVELRDDDRQVLNLTFDPTSLRFQAEAGAASDGDPLGPRERILGVLQQHDSALMIKEISSRAGLSDTSVSTVIKSLEANGEIVRLDEKRGKAILYRRAA